jgi:hypothetical protein
MRSWWKPVWKYCPWYMGLQSPLYLFWKNGLFDRKWLTISSFPSSLLSVHKLRHDMVPRRLHITYWTIFNKFRLNLAREMNTTIWQRNFISINISSFPFLMGTRNSVVVEILCYKPEGRGIASRWGGFFQIYLISASNRNEYQES